MTLTEGERARRRLLWVEWPEWLRRVFRRERAALEGRGVPEARAKEMAWEVASRVDAWRRRGADAKACDRCGTSVLWRHEKNGRVPTTPEGRVHACGDDERGART